MSHKLQNQQIKDGLKKLGSQILNPSVETMDEIKNYEYVPMANKTPNPLIIIEGEEYQTYVNLSCLISDEPLAEHLDKKQIDEILAEFVNNILENPKKFRKKELFDKEIESVIQKFLLPFKEWYVISPIDGLKINFDKISFKNWFIKKFLKREKLKYFTKPNRVFEKHLDEEFVDKYCIIVTVKSNNVKNALKKGEEKIRIILNSIMILHGSNSFCKINDPMTIVATEKETKTGSLKKKYGKPIKCEIQKSESLEQFLSILNPILGLENPNEFEERIMYAINLFGIAIREGTSEDKILKKIIGLESLLIPKVGGKKGVELAFRIALLQVRHNKTFTNPERTSELYKKRNKIVHGNKDKNNLVNKQDVLSLERLASTVIITISDVQSKNNFQNPDEFTKWLKKDDDVKKEMIEWIMNNCSCKFAENFIEMHLKMIYPRKIIFANQVF